LIGDYFSGYHIPPRNNSPWIEIFNESFSTNYIDQGDYIQYDNAWNASYHYTTYATDLSCNMRANLSSDVANGFVHLRTQHDPNIPCNTGYGDILVDYTTASIMPRDIPVEHQHNMRFGPGKFEMRCWLPYISGQWPWIFVSMKSFFCLVIFTQRALTFIQPFIHDMKNMYSLCIRAQP
jgi:hypothetical protein